MKALLVYSSGWLVGNPEVESSARECRIVKNLKRLEKAWFPVS